MFFLSLTSILWYHNIQVSDKKKSLLSTMSSPDYNNYSIFTCLTVNIIQLLEFTTVEQRHTNVLTAKPGSIRFIEGASCRVFCNCSENYEPYIHPFLVIVFSDFLIHRRTFPINNRIPFHEISIITTLTSPSS